MLLKLLIDNIEKDFPIISEESTLTELKKIRRINWIEIQKSQI